MDFPQVEDMAVTDLRAAPRNARTHSAQQIDQIIRSITEFGWTNPILVDEKNVIIAGHGRCAAAEKMELETVPVIRLSALSETQKRALTLADNKLALSAGWDAELLRLELSDLAACGDIELDLTGFSDGELKRILSTDTPDTDAQLTDSLGYRVIVNVDGEREQMKLIERLEAEGFTCQPLIS